MRFVSKKVIVTGPNRSMVRQMALHFAQEGASVVVSYCRSKAGALKTVSDIEAAGGNAVALQADFSTNENVGLFFQEAMRYLGGIDILINNAATLSRDTFFEIKPAVMFCSRVLKQSVYIMALNNFLLGQSK